MGWVILKRLFFVYPSRIAVVARGRGHCVEGQALCDGIVIDTTDLCKVIAVTEDWVDVEAGAAYEASVFVLLLFSFSSLFASLLFSSFLFYIICSCFSACFPSSSIPISSLSFVPLPSILFPILLPMLMIVCSWTDVIEVTASRGRMPFLMPSSWFLSIGGLISVGGMTCINLRFILLFLSILFSSIPFSILLFLSILLSLPSFLFFFFLIFFFNFFFSCFSSVKGNQMLLMKVPIAMTVLLPNAPAVRCSSTEKAENFYAAMGGCGQFG